MRVVVVGGAGFVGLNIAARLAEAGVDVTLVDRVEPASPQRAALGRARQRISFCRGDVTQPDSIESAIRSGDDTVVYGAAITADAARDAAEPERVLAVNLGGIVPVLRAARAAGVRRVVNLSSAAALGRAADRVELIDETLPPDPIALYGLTKFATERVCERLASLWQLDIISVRLSAVFGPFEYATGVRDTLSPIGQIMMAATRGGPALLERPGVRDWVYAKDVAEAVVCIIQAPSLPHRLYNIGPGEQWSALAWGQALAQRRAGFECRLVMPGETPTIDLFAPTDRAPLSVTRLRDELGWSAKFGAAESLEDFDSWAQQWGAVFWKQN